MSQPSDTSRNSSLNALIIEAIAPALIMMLVGSLVFFLIEVFYQGGYSARLNYAFALFVFAAVLISRISIEEGRAYAMMYAVPLAVAILLVAGKFAHIEGPLANISVLINAGFIGLVWWAADKLTWDCTVVDFSQDVSNEGLLRTIKRRFRGDREDHAAAAPAAADDDDEPQGTSSPESQSLDVWWSRLRFRKRKQNAPGVWVVYFSLAALPIFGLGQALIPATHASSRRYVFWLFVMYLLAGLGLLLVTSLLSLQRYLRQRNVALPQPVVVTWIGAGAGMVVLVLIATWLLPRPAPEYVLVEAPFRFTSPDDLQPNRGGTGRDGVQQGSSKAGSSKAGSSKAGSSKAGSSKAGSSQQESSQQGSSKAGSSQQGSSKAGSSQQESSQQGSSQQGGSKAGSSQQGSSQQGSSKAGSSQQESSQQGGSQQGGSDANSSSAAGSQANRSQANRSQAAGSRANRSESRSSSPRFNPVETAQQGFSWFAFLAKMLFYLALLAGVIYAVVRYREQLLASWRKFVAELRELWARLFGGRERVAAAAAAEAEVARAAAPRPFTSFRDPFESGQAARMSGPELLEYSFAALEAWARDHACPRDPQQTPLEFARRLGRADRTVAAAAKDLTGQYSQMAYAPRDSVPIDAAQLQRCWQTLRQRYRGERTRVPEPPAPSAVT